MVKAKDLHTLLLMLPPSVVDLFAHVNNIIHRRDFQEERSAKNNFQA